MADFFLLVAIDVAGLAAIWFFLKARIRRALEIEGLLAESRKEIRLLTIEINETTDRNITLVEDRLSALRELLTEADRRMGVMKKETSRRSNERELYNRLGRNVPYAAGEPRTGAAEGFEVEASVRAEVSEPAEAMEGGPPQSPDFDASGPEPAPVGRPAPRRRGGMPNLAPTAAADEPEPVRLPLARAVPELRAARESVIPPKSLRERALELHRSGFSADIIAARLGATISEVELLVSLEDERQVYRYDAEDRGLETRDGGGLP